MLVCNETGSVEFMRVTSSDWGSIPHRSTNSSFGDEYVGWSKIFCVRVIDGLSSDQAERSRVDGSSWRLGKFVERLRPPPSIETRWGHPTYSPPTQGNVFRWHTRPGTERRRFESFYPDLYGIFAYKKFYVVLA